MNLLEAVRYTKSVRAKQHAAGKVGAIDFKYLLKEHQLWTSAQARSSDGKRIYKTSMVFEGITSSNQPDDKHPVPYSTHGNGVEFYIEQPKSTTRVRMRCQCDDYYFMWSYYNKKDKSLIGPHKTYVPVSPPSGRPPVNPDESAGCCKHLLGMMKTLMVNKVIEKDSEVWGYLTQPPRLI